MSTPAETPVAGPEGRGGLDTEVMITRGDFRLQVAMSIQPGEVVAVVGPNGAGKSTLLRALAGLLPIDTGHVVVAGRVLTDSSRRIAEPAHQRGVGVMFQDYLLFPHLSVLDNVAFGLRCRGLGKSPARRRARAVLERLGIAELASARPGRISGGQAQRAALARALAIDPALLLLDEPLAALDARTRLRVRGELRRQLAGYQGAALVVTHDPVDAAVLADRLVVLEDGAVVQVGTPHEVARRPRTDYVARLVGLNLLAGEGHDRSISVDSGGELIVPGGAFGPVYAAFRPSAVALFSTPPSGSPRNVWSGRVAALESIGDGIRVEIAQIWGTETTIVAEVTPAAVIDLDLQVGAEIWASIKASEIEVYQRG